MSLYLRPRNGSNVAIGCCDRCHLKFYLTELVPDPNAPGLLVCRHDLDQIDPYRLPPLIPDTVALPHVRPDDPLKVPS